MLFDSNLMFSDEQSVLESAASEKIIESYGDVGKGTPVPLCIMVAEDFDKLAALNVEVQTSDDAEFGSGNVQTLVSSSLGVDELVQGAMFPINYIPSGCKQFVRLYYDVILQTVESGTAPSPTKGKITAGIVTALDQGV